MIETFKDIVDYEGLYQISNLGNVKSLPRGNGNGYRERLLKYEIDNRKTTQYARVTLSKDGKTKRVLVHRLVANAFIPNPLGKPLINHVDNNGLNNAVSNLEWCTQSENMKHSAIQGRQDDVRSKGGKATSAIAVQKAKDKYSAMIGTTIGNLTITNYTYDDTTPGHRFKLICKCSCGNVTTKLLSNLVKSSKCCLECSYKQRKIKI